MTQFNLLTEGFVYNVTVPNIREVEADEMDVLLDPTQSGALTTASGEVISLLMDLGFMHSVESIRYKIDPLSTSNLTIQYGRESNNLTTGSLQIVGDEIIVYPTVSGYTYPRYVQLTHTSTTGITLHDLIVYNTEEEVDFGTDGQTTSVTLASPLAEGYGDVTEIPVFNSGTLQADIYVTVDTSLSDRDVFDNLELAPTYTGTFQAFDPNYVPENIPWEWGIFSKSSVNDDNELFIFDPNALEPGHSWSSDRPGSSEAMHWGRNVILPDGTNTFVKFVSSGGWKLIFLDVLGQSSFQTGATLPYSVVDNTHAVGTDFAYDGDDKVYWIRGISTGDGGARELYCYTISTGLISLVDSLPDYNNRWGRMIEYDNGYLYIAGGSSSNTADGTYGTNFTRYEISTGNTVSLASLPAGPATGSCLRVLDGKFYYTTSGDEVYVYHISTNLWGTLPPKPFFQGLTWFDVDTTNKVLWCYQTDDDYCSGSNNHAAYLWHFYVNSNSWAASATALPCAYWATTAGGMDEFALGVNNSVWLWSYRADALRIASYVYDTPPLTVDDALWLSPVFLVRQGVTISGTGESAVVISGLDSFHKVLVDRIENDLIQMTADDSISVETFEIRTSNSSPAGDNTVESFTTSGVETNRHVVGVVDDVFMDQSVLGLEFHHEGSSGNISAGYLYLNSAFATTGKMQYKFWWHPPASKSAGSNNDETSFYIVPYLDTLNTGLSPIRNDLYRRTGGEYIRVKLHSETDTTIFTEISFFKAGAAGSDAYTIDAVGTRYYEVVIVIDWETGDYSLRFDGVELGTGNIPLSSRLFFEPQHSVEFYSCSTGTGTMFTEYFRHLTVSRVGLEARQNFSASPLHIDDPLFGLNGSLPFVTVTENSSVMPVADYLQVRLTFKAAAATDNKVATAVKFPPIVRLPEVNPGESKSVYVRYNFPSSNNLLQEQIYLKAYMATDKE